MKQITFSTLILIFIISCGQNNSETPKELPVENTAKQQVDKVTPPDSNTAIDVRKRMQPMMPSDGTIEIKTFKDSLGWGYDIYVNSKKAIHQPMIPAVSGNQGFANEKDAKKAGEMMAYKIKHGTMPAIMINELDSLKIKYKK